MEAHAQPVDTEIKYKLSKLGKNINYMQDICSYRAWIIHHYLIFKCKQTDLQLYFPSIPSDFLKPGADFYCD